MSNLLIDILDLSGVELPDNWKTNGGSASVTREKQPNQTGIHQRISARNESNHRTKLNAMNESKKTAELIWSKLFSISGQNKTKEEQILMIESVISEVSEEYRKLGRTQILRHIQEEINQLKTP